LSSSIERIAAQQLQSWGQARVSEGQAPVLLDVREDWEYAVAHISPAPFECVHAVMHTLTHRLGELNPQRPVAVLCHHGVRSLMVARFLVQAGFSQVANVEGGIHAWATEMDPQVAIY
jgi:rhodanese-related sulfurtransferase